ncbi:MAG: exo-alpha-sialidase [Bacteroidales bacterium]|nr:exo-alpha-sialidase [Bacteroidales bacterium]
MKIKNILFTILIILPLLTCGQQNPESHTGIEVFNNFRIYPSEVTQTEVFIVRSPMNPELLFSSCNTLNFIPFFVSEGIYVSGDGGNSWQGNDTCIGDPISFHGGDPGIAIDKNGSFILTRLGRAPFTGLYSHYSDDKGQSWSNQQVISTDDLERASVSTDAVPASSYYGRTYASWVKFAQPYPVMFSYTDDGAESWSDPVPVNDPPNRSAGGDVTVGPDGEVYVCWAGVTSTSPFKEIYAGFATSADGGQNWQVLENAFPMNGITGILPEKGNIRVNGLPLIAVDSTNATRKGWIYIVTGQKDLPPAGNDPDIILNRSTDGGQTWSEGIRVNQDALNNGKIQYFPAVHVDKFGAVNVLFYDDRNTTSDSTGVFLARSTDGGDTWKEYEISDHNFKPNSIGGLGQGYQGDNIDLTSNDEKIFPVWMDNSSGIYQIWTAPVDFSVIGGVNDISSTETEISVFPNPFSQETSIRFNLSHPSEIQLRIFNINGVEEAKIEMKGKAGKNHIKWDGNELSSGIYFVQILIGKQNLTGKIIKI